MVVEYLHLLHLSQDRRQRIYENFLKTSNKNIRKFECSAHIYNEK